MQLFWSTWILFIILSSCYLEEVTGEESCVHSAKMDLQIIVDTSKSVKKKNFRILMEKISRSLISQFDIGPDRTRVALFKYSSSKIMRNEFSLSGCTSMKELQARIESTRFRGGYTLTAMAMRKALKLYTKAERQDGDTAKVCLVFTDGVANDEEQVPAASKAWADHGVTVFAIGISDQISDQGLLDIAGDEERAFRVNDFAAISQLAKPLLKEICAEVLPTTTPGNDDGDGDDTKDSGDDTDANANGDDGDGGNDNNDGDDGTPVDQENNGEEEDADKDSGDGDDGTPDDQGNTDRVDSVCTSWKKEKQMTLHCPVGKKIEVIRAFYGYWDSDVEKCYYQAGDCQTTTDNPTCSGNSCLVTAEESSFSLDCLKIHDYMQVEFRCVDA